MTYAEKLSKEEARIDWSLSLQLDCITVTFNPWPMSWIKVDEQPVKVWKASSLAVLPRLNPVRLWQQERNSGGDWARDPES